jgi:hypothetical protein
MAGDIAGLLRLHHPVRSIEWHGTNTLGYSWLVTYPCERMRDVYQCTNALGDSFRYAP